jgi:hypothetical protein
MSLIDRTNEDIALSMPRHRYDSGKGNLYVDVDADSSIHHERWVNLQVTDYAHDGDIISLTLEEAGLLHDRLGLILGRSGTKTNPEPRA